MATKPQQFHKLTKIRNKLVEYKVTVKSLNPILENLFKRDKPLLDAKILQDLERMVRDRGYLKQSRLRTTEIDREIRQLLEELHTAFTSGTSAPPQEAHTKQHPNKVVRPEPNPKKRTAATSSSSEPRTKRPRPATSPCAAREHEIPSRPFIQPAEATVPPWPLKSVALGWSHFLLANENCSPAIDVYPQDQSFRVYDQKKWLLDPGVVLSIQAKTITKIFCSRPDRQIRIRSASGEVNLRFALVKYLDQVVHAIEQNGSNVRVEQSRCSSWPRVTADDSEQDSFSKVKEEAEQCGDGSSRRPKRSTRRRKRAYGEHYSDDSSDDDWVPGRDCD